MNASPEMIDQAANGIELRARPSGGLNKQLTDLPHRRRSPRALAKDWLFAMCGVRSRLAANDGLLLTFDDGPDPAVTPAVLDLLAKFDARAVFFIVGDRIPKAPHVLQRILDEGHLIGNHTYYHPLDRIPRFAEYYRDVNKCQQVLESLTGRRPSLFRPPLGSITIASLLAPRLAGLRTVMWSVDVDDWTLRSREDAQLAALRLVDSSHRGDIVLLHDDNPSVIRLLEMALPRLRERRFDLGHGVSQFNHPARS
jgi:peptidoglycan/xylan/chitin deacetylase (PgdA/CDA1 family)